ncbi:hypothetical protein Q1695_015927 [Nippostrongylus brasiliensis]|nr:hypothetical protein Q1695_015927 [Nippostrongylus brasiliensis]
MFSIVLSAAILTTIFADDIDFNNCIRSPETSLLMNNKSTLDRIFKKIPRNILHYRPEVEDVVYSYMKFTPPMYVFVMIEQLSLHGIKYYQYGAVNNGTMTRMMPDHYGTIYNAGLTKCTEYSNDTENNDEPPYEESTGNPESRIPAHVRRKRYVDL